VPAVNTIGHLASALVVIAAEQGKLFSADETETQALGSLCSREFLQIYPNLMASFGWGEFLHGTDQDALVKCLLLARDEMLWRSQSDERIIEEWLYYGWRAYCDRIPGNSRNTLSSDLTTDIRDYVIHLTGQGVLFAFCNRIPRNALYRPLEPFALQQHARLIRSLIDPSSKSYKFQDFYIKAIESLVPSAFKVTSTDLAVAGGGYVAYSGALEDWDRNLTDRRRVLTLHMAPGPMKMRSNENSDPGCVVSRITEDESTPTLRVLNTHDDGITLYQGGKCCFNEREAYGHGTPLIIHRWRLSNTSGPQILYISTSIQVGNGSWLDRSANWERSLEVLAFAHHIDKPVNCRADQLQELAEEWRRSGYLDQNLRWAPPGTILVPKIRYVSVTSGYERLRFLEAGNFAGKFAIEKRRVFIRHGSVPLIECIKVAMEICKESPGWVIIS